MPTATRPFDDIRALLRQMPEADEAAIASAREREGQLIKPAGSLGRLEAIAEWMAGWRGSGRRLRCGRPAGADGFSSVRH
jgi:nicotinate-nucleotide--dimethylbenzimidazole phosphoribosyltransferase